MGGLDTNMLARRKMSQAEKQRGWVKMKNVSAVKISIQGLTGMDELNFDIQISVSEG